MTLTGCETNATLDCVGSGANAPKTLRAFPSAIFARLRWAIREQTQRDPCLPSP